MHGGTGNGVEHRAPAVLAGIGGHAGGSRFGEAVEQISRHGGSGLGRPGTEAQRTHHAAFTEHPDDLGQPCFVFAFHALAQSGAESFGEGAGLVTTGAGFGSNHHRAKVAQVDLGKTGLGGFGPVPPFGGVEPLLEALTECEEDLGGDLGLAGASCGLVLPCDLCAEAGDAPVEEDPADKPLFVGQGLHGGVPVGVTRSQPWSLWSCWGVVVSLSATTLLPAPFVPTLSLGLALRAAPGIPGTITPTLSLGLALRAAPGIPGTITPTLSLGLALRAAPGIPGSATLPGLAFAVAVLVVATSLSAHQARRHIRLLAGIVEEFEQNRTAALVAGRQYGRDRHAVEKLVGFHTQDIPHGGRLGEECPVERSAGFPCADGTPGPGSVLLGGGELDLDAWHG